MAPPTTTFLLLLPVLIQTTLSHAFIVVVNINPPPSFLSAAAAAASSKKKKKRAFGGRRSGEGGFGSSSTTTSRDIVYPELDPQVVKTLIPYNYEQGGSSGGILPMEIYDRLDEIYGFDKFNFGGENAIYKSIRTTTTAATTTTTTDVNDDASSLFDDILSGGHSTLAWSDDKSHSLDFNTISPFKQFRILHTDPMVLAIDDFFTIEECDRYVQLSIDSEKLREEDRLQQQQASSYVDDGDKDKNNMMIRPMVLGQSRTIGKDSYSRAQRTSTTWFHYYGGVPELVSKASRLLGLDNIDQWEEPQTVRYRRNEQFTWHLDALSPSINNRSNVDDGAGQRIATLLVYLTDLPEEDGGATMFRDLGDSNNGVRNPLKVRPTKGTALLFFPAAGGLPNVPFDIRTLHCGEAVAMDAMSEKWIAQLWLRQRPYKATAPIGNDHSKAYEAIDKYCVQRMAKE